MVTFQSMSKETIKGGSIPLRGELTPPGDKSISHRAIIVGSLAKGATQVKGFLSSDDTLSSANAMRMLGVPIEINNTNVEIKGKGLLGLREPEDFIDAGNSGTTARLLTGLLSAQNFFTAITGDKYLRVRPMERVVRPLTLMGGKIWGRDEGKRLPLAIQGAKLSAIKYQSPVASAQVKSTILLAGLYAEGETEFVEPTPTRDHTERMLSYLGVDIRRNGTSVRVKNAPEFKGAEISVPADISSAAFFIVSALINPSSEILIKNVGITPQRMGVIEILKRMGGRIEILDEREAGSEPVGDILVRSSVLRSVQIKGDMIPKAIDELPIISVAACFAEGETVIKDAKELRVKETDRIRAMTTELRKLGAQVEEFDDGMIIVGKENLNGAMCSSWGDHRIAMAIAVAGSRAEGVTEIEDTECVSVSFPGFFDVMRRLRRG